jgi:hypothetical protein
MLNQAGPSWVALSKKESSLKHLEPSLLAGRSVRSRREVKTPLHPLRDPHIDSSVYQENEKPRRTPSRYHERGRLLQLQLDYIHFVSIFHGGTNNQHTELRYPAVLWSAQVQTENSRQQNLQHVILLVLFDEATSRISNMLQIKQQITYLSSRLR